MSRKRHSSDRHGSHHRQDIIEDLDPSEGQSDWQLRLFLLLLRSRKRDAFLDHPKADVIKGRRLIRAERIIAVALAHDDFLDPMKDRFIVRFLNADSDELRPDVLPEN